MTSSVAMKFHVPSCRPALYIS